MLTCKLDLPGAANILCLGAHCDDIEIGCGGTLVELRQQFPGARFHWVVFSGEHNRDQETHAAARQLLGKGSHCSVDVQQFRGSYFPTCLAGIKDYFETVKQRPRPDLIFTHYLGDRHQDHRVISEMTWNTFRDHAILEYEIPKYEGDLAHPNLYSPLSEASLERKLRALMQCFPSQRSRTWFDEELFRGHLRLRGVECNSPSRFAEAFHARKLRL